MFTAARTKTAVLVQQVGIGDLLWHMPYFERIAHDSAGGQVAVIASPSTGARDLLDGCHWVSSVIDFDRHPRKHENRKGRHAGVIGLLRIAAELRPHRFDRILMFSGSVNRALMAWLARIPQRGAYGFSATQRLFLNQPPYIKRYAGSSVAVFSEAASFSIAHGLCSERLVPRLTRPETLIDLVKPRLAHLPRPLYAFAIGTSEPYKQWGSRNYASLATWLLSQGCGVLLLGGPSEEALALEIMKGVPPRVRPGIHAQTRESIGMTIAALWLSDACVGNDTGVTNLAVACDRPAFVLLGPRPLLDLDPRMTMLQAARLECISVEAVWTVLNEHRAPGFECSDAPHADIQSLPALPSLISRSALGSASLR